MISGPRLPSASILRRSLGLPATTFRGSLASFKGSDSVTDVQSPGEIKRREMSWTLRKKLAQKRSRAGRWCWAGELDFFCFTCFPTTELRTLFL